MAVPPVSGGVLGLPLAGAQELTVAATNIARFFGWYAGEVSVVDQTNGIRTIAVVVTQKRAPPLPLGLNQTWRARLMYLAGTSPVS